jgi:hypothetical protein
MVFRDNDAGSTEDDATVDHVRHCSRGRSVATLVLDVARTRLDRVRLRVFFSRLFAGHGIRCD